MTLIPNHTHVNTRSEKAKARLSAQKPDFSNQKPDFSNQLHDQLTNSPQPKQTNHSKLFLFLSRNGICPGTKKPFVTGFVGTFARSQVEPAGFMRRLKSSFLDSLFFWALILLILAPISIFIDVNFKSIFVTLAGVRSSPDYNEAFLIINMLGVLPILYLWSKFQSTPGKMITCTRIIDYQTGAAPSKKQLFVRALSYIVSSLPLGLGFIWIVFSPTKRAWHDHIAGTQVVKISPNKY